MKVSDPTIVIHHRFARCGRGVLANWPAQAISSLHAPPQVAFLTVWNQLLAPSRCVRRTITFLGRKNLLAQVVCRNVDMPYLFFCHGVLWLGKRGCVITLPVSRLYFKEKLAQQSAGTVLGVSLSFDNSKFYCQINCAQLLGGTPSTRIKPIASSS